jgi:CBS domain-containing protein
MNVAQLMQSQVKTCGIEDTLHRAAQLMWEGDFGCVPIVDKDLKVVGVITDRDACMGAYTQGKPLHEIPVRLCMSKQVWSCRADDALSTAEKLMQDRRIRRLPVVDGAGRLVGIISLNDIALQASRTRSEKRKPVSDAEVGETLAAICEQRLSCAGVGKPSSSMEAAA